MDLYLVVGNPNTRRASLVRSLTGCFNRSVRDIELLSGRATLKLYARVGSLQETKTTPADFLTEIAAARCNAVLCCVVPNAHPSSPTLYPPAQTYLEYFKEAGLRIRAIAVLGQNSGGLKSPTLRQFPQSGTVPINLTASAVRRHFGWH
jgi:hypothetical protein